MVYGTIYIVIALAHPPIMYRLYFRGEKLWDQKNKTVSVLRLVTIDILSIGWPLIDAIEISFWVVDSTVRRIKRIVKRRTT